MAVYNVLQRTEQPKKLELENFQGFDFSSSPLSVDKHHAIDGRNMIIENGVNHKRNGWIEKIRFASGGKVNGLWEFTDINGETHTICHCGNKIYRIYGLQTQVNSFDQNVEDLTTKEGSDVNLARINTDMRSFAVVQNNRLYIFCGDYLQYVRRDTWVLERVENNRDTYIPTTTISIDAVNSANNDAVSFEEVNMLTKYRKNKLTVPHDIDDAKYNNGVMYYLDSLQIDMSEVIVEVEKVVNNDLTVYEYRNKVMGEMWGTDLYKYPFEENGKSIGQINFGSSGSGAGLKFNNRDTIKSSASEAGSDSITVTFAKTNTAYSSRITKCTIGTMFGTNGNTDRLFVTGNSEYKNVDFFSAMDDLTYFGDQSSAVIGSNTVPIMSYSRLGDGTLAIHKADSSQEATIYYRSGDLEAVYADIKDENGQVIGQKQVGSRAVFPLKSGSIGEGVITSYANCNLSGDNLMLSQNGVYGIVLGQNVATNERFARERSRTINDRLVKETNLSNAVGVVYKNKYYLAVNGHCYVADSRYIRRTKEDMADTFNYEWWYWDNVPARVFAVFNNRLYFGTTDGRICVFQEGEYADKSFIKLGAGDVAIDYPSSTVIFNQEYKDLLDRLTYKKQGQRDYMTVKGRKQTDSGVQGGYLYMYRIKASDIERIENNRIYLSELTRAASGAGLITSLSENEVVYINGECDGLEVNRDYRISEIDIGERSFGLKLSGETDDGLIQLNDSTEICFDICRRLNGEELELHTDETGYYVSLKGFADKIEFCMYNNETVIIAEACLILQDNVIAEWYTPIMDLGTPEYAKNLKQLTIVAESNISSEIKVGYETRRTDKLYYTRGTSLFDFNEIDFNDFTFETNDFCKSYTRKIREKKINYIIFRIISDNDRDMAVNKIIVTYQVGKKLKGIN